MQIGPPKRPPKRLSRKAGFGRPEEWRSQVFAFRTLFCKYSYTAPWNWFEPRRVTICTSPPADREKLAPEFVVTTRNSSSLSLGVGTTARGVAVKFVPLYCPPPAVLSVPSPPSIKNVLLSLRAAATCPPVLSPSPVAFGEPGELKPGFASGCNSSSP